jgi:hypothetical protein
MIFELDLPTEEQQNRLCKLYSDMQSVLLIPNDPHDDHNGYDLIDVKSDIHLLVMNYIKELNGIVPDEDIQPWIRIAGEELKKLPTYSEWGGI